MQDAVKLIGGRLDMFFTSRARQCNVTVLPGEKHEKNFEF